MGSLRNVRRSCGLGNAAGLAAILYLTKKNEVTAITAPGSDTDEISGASALTMATSPAGTFKILELSPILSKKSWETTTEGDADSPSYKTVVVGFLPATDAVRGNILGSLAGCEYLVVAKDNNTKRRLLGDLDTGATLTIKETINDGANGYEITVTCEGKNHMPYYLNSNVALTLAADA